MDNPVNHSVDQRICDIGRLEKSADGIVTLTITCTDSEVTADQVKESNHAIESISGGQALLLVDTTEPHSLSFDALFETTKTTCIKAAAIVAPNKASQNSALFIEDFHNTIGKSPYPIKIFPNSSLARQWLESFL